MPKRLNGKVAVVTGASKGIGAGIGRHHAAEGAAVVVNYASSRASAERLVADIASQGGKAVPVQLPTSRPGSQARSSGRPVAPRECPSRKRCSAD
jgi:NAD(P)-dependent dehydrogenase (short-subunit alcohol dehydrogenase family)